MLFAIQITPDPLRGTGLASGATPPGPPQNPAPAHLNAPHFSPGYPSHSGLSPPGEKGEVLCATNRRWLDAR